MCRRYIIIAAALSCEREAPRVARQRGSVCCDGRAEVSARRVHGGCSGSAVYLPVFPARLSMHDMPGLALGQVQAGHRGGRATAGAPACFSTELSRRHILAQRRSGCLLSHQKKRDLSVTREPSARSRRLAQPPQAAARSAADRGRRGKTLAKPHAERARIFFILYTVDHLSLFVFALHTRAPTTQLTMVNGSMCTAPARASGRDQNHIERLTRRATTVDHSPGESARARCAVWGAATAATCSRRVGAATADAS